MPRVHEPRSNLYVLVATTAVLAFFALVAWPPVLFLVIILTMSYVGTKQLERRLLRYRTLLVKGNQLLCLGEQGELVAEIDLTQPFEAECIHVGQLPNRSQGQTGFWGLYKVRQGREVFRFTSEAKGAEEVVPNRLSLPWPPIASGFWWNMSTRELAKVSLGRHNTRIKLTACGTLTHRKKQRRSHAVAYPHRYAYNCAKSPAGVDFLT
jgi:hypothetical protein